MKFLIDANLPTRLARWLEDQGHDAVHVAALSSGAYAELHRTLLVVNTQPGHH